MNSLMLASGNLSMETFQQGYEQDVTVVVGSTC